MHINKIITTTLKPLGVPVVPFVYTGDGDTYITFFTYLEQGEEFADDDEIVTGLYIQLDVWSKSSRYIPIAEKAKELLKEKGFIRKKEYEFYESDTKIYRKCIRFYYANEN